MLKTLWNLTVTTPDTGLQAGNLEQATTVLQNIAEVTTVENDVDRTNGTDTEDKDNDEMTVS